MRIRPFEFSLLVYVVLVSVAAAYVIGNWWLVLTGIVGVVLYVRAKP